MHGEAAGTGIEAAASYLEDLAQITGKGGCTKQKNFNGDETALHGNKMLWLAWLERGQCLASRLQRTV